MSVFEHNRTKIFNPAQHPLQHDLSAFAYTNPRLPGINNFDDAIDYIVAVLYPNYIGTYATPAALPGVASPNDYAFVTDDGDGKSAGYIYASIDGVTAWVKRYDVDWSAENIFAETINRTQVLYMAKYGNDDKDNAGATVVGTFAGQQVYGGVSTNTNLTLNANSFDTTGFVQTTNTFRPTTTSTYDLGTSSEKFKDLHLSQSAIVSTMTVAGGSITDSSGSISFGNENLSTTGTLASGVATIAADITIGVSSIVSTAGNIDFGSNDLDTLGTVTGASLNSNDAIIADITINTGSITSLSAAISFGTNDLTTTGDITATDASFGLLSVDDVRVNGNIISAIPLNSNLIIQANGTGIVDVQNSLTTLGITATGVVGVTGQLNVDNLRLDGNTLSSTDANGNISLTPNGTGKVITSANVEPQSDAANALGDTAKRFTSLFLSSSVTDGTLSIAIATLLAFRNALVGVGSGMSLFYNNISGTFEPSIPDTEIDHGSLTGILDDDHTQYALLAGRSGGQTLYGSTLASEHLTLSSTSHGTKGNIIVDSVFRPNADASYSGSWSGIDLGKSSERFRHVYSAGEFFGLRLQNTTSGGLPAASAANVGRAVWATDNETVYIDNGGAWVAVGNTNKHVSDTSWNGSDVTKDINISASGIADARNCIVQLLDNSNDFERVYCAIKAISATTVRIEVGSALPAGSYRLIAIE